MLVAVRPPDLALEVTVAPGDAELAADRLWQAGATAVEVRDGAATTTLVASYPTEAATRQVAGELGARVVELDPTWRDAWREHAEAVEVGSRLTVAPAWRDVPLGAGRLVLRIDPGDCFGSGSHASTRWILAALDERPPAPGQAVLDAGCGSGILAVAAAALAPGVVVTAVDIDPAAVAATEANAAANDVAGRIRASTCPVADLIPPAGGFELALVNVTAAVHAELGPAVTERVRPGGRILLAGLLPGQWRHVAGAYPGTTVAARGELDGWEGLELVTASLAVQPEGAATSEAGAATDEAAQPSRPDR